MPQPRRAPRVCTLTLYHDPESDHIALDLDTPAPCASAAQRAALARLLRRALDRLEDKIAWDHVGELVAKQSNELTGAP
jgi:hypothetical protein